MRKLKVAMSIALMVALVLPMSAGAQSPNPGEEVVQRLLGLIEVAANQNGGNAQDVLNARIKINFSDGTDPAEVTVEEAILRIAGHSLIDTNNFNGILGTPQLNAGNILHILADVNVETWTAANGFPFGIARTALPPPPEQPQYDVVESTLTPNTPLLAAPNPLLLTGQELPPELPPSLSQPILVLHAGGRLKSVQASGYTAGFHSAGTTVVGSNVDTEARATADGDPWPIWIPILTGELLRPDTQIDFLGFAIVAQGQSCTTIPATGSRVFARICTMLGTLLGDGVSLFDGAPVDLREVTSALAVWDPAPAPISDVVATLDDLVAQIQDAVGDVPVPSVPTVPSTTSTQSAPTLPGLGGLKLRR